MTQPLCWLLVVVLVAPEGSPESTAISPNGSIGSSDGVELDASYSEPKKPMEPNAESGEPSFESTEPSAESTELIAEDLDIEDFQNMSLKELLGIKTVTATKTESTIDEAPAAISIITKDEIRRWGYRSVAEVLQRTTGFYLVDDHVLPNAGVRGIPGGLSDESSSIKVMINGASVSFRATSGNWLGAELVPISAIERIEIIRGAASALYGADAFLAVVNIILRDGEELSGYDLRASIFPFGETLGGDVDYSVGGRIGDFEILLAGRLYEEDRSGIELPESSPAPSIPTNLNSRKTRNLRLVSRGGLGRLTYHFGSGHRVSLFGSVSQLGRGAEFSSWTQLASGIDSWGRSNRTWISLYQGQAGLSGRLVLSESLSIDARIFYFQGGPSNDDRIEVGSDIFYIRRKFGYRGFDASLDGRWKIFEQLTVVAGTELTFDNERLPAGKQILKFDSGSFHAGDVLNLEATRRGTIDLTNFGAFGQVLWKPFESYLGVSGNIRFDYHNIYGPQISGRVGLTSSPLKELNLKLFYGNAFKAPSPLLLYGQPFKIGDSVGNPDLKPQYVHTVEGHVAYTPFEWIRLSTGLTYSRLLDKAEFLQKEVNRIAQNLSSVSGFSWETEVVAQYLEYVTGYFRFELHHMERDFGKEGYLAQLLEGESVIYPPWIARLGISGKILDTLPMRLGVEAMLVGPRRASELNILANAGSYELDPYLTLEATITFGKFRIFGNQGTYLHLRGKNLSDARGPDPGYAGVDYPLAPRTIYLEINQELN